ncbi:MAG: deoxyguanosinetriphosphate triphosphohydrolase [Burkholderiales bacterium]|nr:deoxyguanosinetriphosphate triphosphohydrolase [Burkholderiales bacterium]OJX05621.1 MAG: deoxyguanosinetriphosphate triphosphohydrolase [Burkholderiales bacterium 70-64]
MASSTPPSRAASALAPWAADPLASRGRRHREPPPTPRSEFQRDRDRIVHCTAFRRLEYKTQVFVNHEGDLFRTRLTHSIEVAQIARSIGRGLGLCEDLVEAIALAHDLGHTPFGHAGQDALDACMRTHGGFEHNLQSLRVVDELEQCYGGFDGLNLCFETREGILKHCSRESAAGLGELGARFLERRQPSLEAQVANLADEIAYNNHDVDDGLRSGLIRLEQLDDIDLFAGHRREVERAYPGIAGRRLVHETIRRMINDLVTDLIGETRRRIAAAGPRSIDDVRAAAPLAAFSAPMRERATQLKGFLHVALYRHPRVDEVMARARAVMRRLFEAYAADPSLLPEEHRGRVEALGLRAVADYIAGMTDRFALREYARLTGETAFGPGLPDHP